MTPTVALICAFGPTVLAIGHSIFLHWSTSKSHPAAVKAGADAAAAGVNAGAQAAIAALQAGASGKDAGRAAAVAAVAGIASALPQITVQDPTVTPPTTAGG